MEPQAGCWPAAAIRMIADLNSTTIDAENDLLILIVEPVADGEVHLWSSGTDLTREQREEAEEDVDNFSEIGAGGFKVFERL